MRFDLLTFLRDKKNIYKERNKYIVIYFSYVSLISFQEIFGVFYLTYVLKTSQLLLKNNDENLRKILFSESYQF